jgi:uncharacterized membrane protein
VTFVDVIEWSGKVIDGVGVAIIAIGSLTALLYLGVRLLRGGDRGAIYDLGRQSLGRVILLGLELLVAADIIRTVATSPTFTSVGVLGLIVLIRTFLSYSLEMEISGRWPWQRRAAGTQERPDAI